MSHPQTDAQHFPSHAFPLFRSSENKACAPGKCSLRSRRFSRAKRPGRTTLPVMQPGGWTAECRPRRPAAAVLMKCWWTFLIVEEEAAGVDLCAFAAACLNIRYFSTGSLVSTRYFYFLVNRNLLRVCTSGTRQLQTRDLWTHICGVRLSLQSLH